MSHASNQKRYDYVKLLGGGSPGALLDGMIMWTAPRHPLDCIPPDTDLLIVDLRLADIEEPKPLRTDGIIDLMRKHASMTVILVHEPNDPRVEDIRKTSTVSSHTWGWTAYWGYPRRSRPYDVTVLGELRGARPTETIPPVKPDESETDWLDGGDCDVAATESGRMTPPLPSERLVRWLLRVILPPIDPVDRPVVTIAWAGIGASTIAAIREDCRVVSLEPDETLIGELGRHVTRATASRIPGVLRLAEPDTVIRVGKPNRR